MKILIVGLGSIGQRHLRNLLALYGDAVEISAYRVRKEQTVLTSALTVEKDVSLDEKYGYTLYDNYDAALDAKPDAVIISNPTSLHVTYALKAARKGCHLFIEKPLSHNLDGIDELEEIINEKRIVCFIGFQLRFHPCLIKLREMLESDRAGAIMSIHVEVGEYLPATHTWEDYRRMYASRKDLGGGVVVSQSHEIDYIIDLYGMPKSVYALGGKLSSLDLDVEDLANVLMECVIRKRRIPLFLHMDFIQRPTSRGCRVIGQEGSLKMDLVRQTTVFTDTEGKQDIFDYHRYQRNQLYLDELTHFVDCVQGKDTPRINIAHAYKVMKVAMAIKTSMETGAKVELE